MAVRAALILIIWKPLYIITTPLRWGWRFLGRMGIALRTLLMLLLLEPIGELARPLLSKIWRLLGRMGAALRTIIRFLWKGVRLFSSKLWYLWGRTGLALRALLSLLWTGGRQFATLSWRLLTHIWRGITALSISVWRLLGRMGIALRTLLVIYIITPAEWAWRMSKGAVQRRWQAGKPARLLRRRRFESRWMVIRAQWRVRLRRPRPPATAVIVPRHHSHNQYRRNPAQRMRWVTAVLSISIVTIASFATIQKQQPSSAIADRDNLSHLIIATPSPQPPTPLPSPTVPVRLTPWPTPDPFNKGGTLAFDQRYKGNGDIFALSFGQSYPTRLTSHAADDRQPAWASDGQSIAFASQRDENWELYIYDLNLGTLTRLTNDPAYDGNPAWSPDGEWIVYDSYHQNNMDIYVIKADGSEGPYRLTENAALDYEPAWSPNGRFLSFVSHRNGSPDLFIMPLDSVSDGTAVNVTNSPAIAEKSPAFSPDGLYLAYSEASSSVPMLHAIPLDGGVNAAGASRNLGQQGERPVWSPDSQTILAVYEQGSTNYLIGGSINAWGIAPQLYAGAGDLGKISWSAVSMSPDLIEHLRPVDDPKPDIPLFTETISNTKSGSPPVTLSELPINAPAPYLSDEVDQSFLALRQRVMDEAGWDFLGRLDGMFEPLESGSPPGIDTQSWNKAGRAFDIYARAVMRFDPQVEVVMDEHDGRTYWRIYLRADAQDGTQGEPLYAVPWDFQARYGDEPTFYEQGGKLKDEIPSGYYVDFTQLAADYGWTAVPSQENWRSYFPAIRFWHFENRGGLNWEEGMLRIYSKQEMEIMNTE